MSGLVDELQQLASTPGISVADLLRKAKVVAVKLKQKETAGWIDAELSGDFRSMSEAPPYHAVPVRLMQRNPYHGMLPLSFSDEKINAAVSAPRPLLKSVRELEELAGGSEDKLYLSMPPESVAQLVQWGAPPDLSHMISRSSLVGIIDAIKTRVLDWALGLEENGVRGEGMSFSPEEVERAESITINFSGTTNFAGVIGTSTGTAAADVTQTVDAFSGAALRVARDLRAGAAEVPDDGTILNKAADTIEEAVALKDPGKLRGALELAKAILPKIGVFAAKKAADIGIAEIINHLPH